MLKSHLRIFPKETDPCDLWKGMCFGPETAKYANTLRDYVSEELKSGEYYRALIKKARFHNKRLIRNIRKDELFHAKRIAAVYFLSTGINYSPQPEKIKNVPPFPIALREQFKLKCASAASYEKIAEETEDTELRKLFFEMATDEKRHAILLRNILEKDLMK